MKLYILICKLQNDLFFTYLNFTINYCYNCKNKKKVKGYISDSEQKYNILKLNILKAK